MTVATKVRISTHNLDAESTRDLSRFGEIKYKGQGRGNGKNTGPGISSKCQNKQCWRCTKLTCICECHKLNSL